MNENIITENKIGSSTWVDITNPTLDKIQTYQKKYNLHKADINAIFDKAITPRTFEHKNYLFVALYTGMLDHHDKIIFQELNIFFSKRFIITVHSKSDTFLTKLTQHNNKNEYHDSAHVLYHILQNINNNYSQILEHFTNKVNKLELDISTHKNPKQSIIDQILNLRKELLFLMNISKPNEFIYQEIYQSKIFENNFSTYTAYISNLAKSQTKNCNLIQHNINIIDGLISIVNIIINNKFNEIIRILTIVSVALLPLTLLTGILGMNFPSIIFNTPYGFFISIFLMILLEIIILNYFKYKKWL